MTRKGKNTANYASENNEADIETCIRECKANQALEGLSVTPETENLAREMLRGNITFEQARDRALAQYGIRVATS